MFLFVNLKVFFPEEDNQETFWERRFLCMHYWGSGRSSSTLASKGVARILQQGGHSVEGREGGEIN